jgi:hypothetical protein
MRSLVLLSIAAAAFALSACAEREQTAGGIKSDAAPHLGTDRQPPYMAADWKAGDRASWEQHMKVRTVNGQNEYVRIP